MAVKTCTHTHTHTTVCQHNLGEPVPEETPTHAYHGQSSLIGFLHLLRSMASSQFNLRA